MRSVWVLGWVAGAACRFGFSPPAPLDAPVHDSPSVSMTDAMRVMPPGDAGICDDSLCAAAGGACVDGACEIVATGEGLLQCPDAMPCRLVCNGYRYCRDGARCGGATWCQVQCLGYRACQDGVDCASSQCAVTCNGEEACESGIDVGAGGTCTSECCGLEACAGGVDTCMNSSC